MGEKDALGSNALVEREECASSHRTVFPSTQPSVRKDQVRRNRMPEGEREDTKLPSEIISGVALMLRQMMIDDEEVV
jgi:hypothetical protein